MTHTHKLFVLESGLSKASETTRKFFSRVSVFYCTRNGNKVHFWNALDTKDMLECHIKSVEGAGSWCRIVTTNSVINIAVAPSLYKGRFVGVASGDYKDFRWEIDSDPNGPVAYVVTDRWSEYCPHGGVTWEGPLSRKRDEEFRMGWDYGHCGDWDPLFPSGKRWTLPEVLKEVKAYIDNIV